MALSFYDAEGDRLSKVQLGRMPAKYKTLSQKLAAVLGQWPGLTLVKLADGPKDNRSYFGTVPLGIEIIGFYHACEHLKAIFDASYGANSSRSKSQFEECRHVLRDEQDSVEKIIRLSIRSNHIRFGEMLALFKRVPSCASATMAETANATRQVTCIV